MDESRLLHVALTLVTLILSITVHEYSHALAAHKLGDDFAARSGRLTLNPMAHADPIGTLLVPAISAFLGGGMFGWGRPVPYIPTNLTRKMSMRAAEAIIAVAGPASNLVMGIVCGGLLVGLSSRGVLAPDSAFAVLLQSMMVLNIVLFFFNMIPVPPLDGAKVVAWILGQKADVPLDAIASMGMMPLMLVMMVGGSVISFPVGIVLRLIVAGFQHMLA